jgi:hypothetical protein
LRGVKRRKQRSPLSVVASFATASKDVDHHRRRFAASREGSTIAGAPSTPIATRCHWSTASTPCQSSTHPQINVTPSELRICSSVSLDVVVPMFLHREPNLPFSTIAPRREQERRAEGVAAEGARVVAAHGEGGRRQR